MNEIVLLSTFAPVQGDLKYQHCEDNIGIKYRKAIIKTLRKFSNASKPIDVPGRHRSSSTSA